MTGQADFRSRVNWPWIAAGLWGAVFIALAVIMFWPAKKVAVGTARSLPATSRSTGVPPVSGAPGTGGTPVLRRDRPRSGSVYPDFTSAAEHWLDSEPLYVRGGTNEFRYSPLVAALFVPFDFLPAKLGELLWRSINFAVFLGALYLCCRWWIPYRFSPNQIAAVFLLVIPLAVGSLNNAQSNPLVLGLMLLATAAITRRWFAVAALSIALATCFKLYPIALGMLLVLRFPWRLGWRLAVCLVAAAVLPFLLQRANYVWSQYAEWSHYLISEDRQRGPIGDWYRDLRAVSRVYVRSMPLLTYQVIEVAAGALIAGICLAGLFRGWTLRAWAGTAFGLACCWMTAIGPATESATYILLAPALAWGMVFTDDRGRGWRLAYGIVFGLFLSSQLALNIPGGRFFRDHLQPLPIAGTMQMLILLVDAFLRLMPRKEEWRREGAKGREA